MITKITKITKITNNSKRYDIEVNNTHCLFANNILVHNCSGTFFFDKDKQEFNACSRNLLLNDGDNTYYNIAKKYKLPDILKDNPNLVVQGEIAGTSIQNNRVGLKEQQLFVFNIFDRNENKYVGFATLFQLCKQWNIPTVPLDEEGESFDYTLEQLLEKAKGYYDKEKKLLREGIVIRPKTETYSMTLKGRLSFKVINNDYLLKHGE